MLSQKTEAPHQPPTTGLNYEEARPHSIAMSSATLLVQDSNPTYDTFVADGEVGASAFVGAIPTTPPRRRRKKVSLRRQVASDAEADGTGALWHYHPQVSHTVLIRTLFSRF